MFRIDWRMAILALLFLGPFAIFVGLGWAWVHERGWALPAFGAWVLVSLLFSVLSVRWTRTRRPVLTPLDWTAPQTFAPRDREAWNLVQADAERAERATPEELISIDFYVSSATHLSAELARFYHPKSTDPIEYVPLVDLLTAIELATEDLNAMIREIPGGDIVSLAHWKTAVGAANFVSRANEYYNYLMPLVQPVQGVVRLGAHKLMGQPAWRNMRENVLRWFFRAYVQRLGMHLIEMYSGRLAIGAAGYRRLTRRGQHATSGTPSPLGRPLRIALAGAQGAGKARLKKDLEAARDSAFDRGNPTAVPPRPIDPALVPLLNNAEFLETPGYPSSSSWVPFRNHLTQQGALNAAVQADMLILLIDASREEFQPEIRLLQDWADWFTRESHLETPPALVILAAYGSDDPATPYKPILTTGEVRARREALHLALPSGMVAQVVSLGLEHEPEFDVARHVLPAVTALLYRAERCALIHDLYDYCSRSKIGRIASQVGRQSKRAWHGLSDEARRRFVPRSGSNSEPEAQPKTVTKPNTK